MKINPIDPPRTFGVGPSANTKISHCANIGMEPNEQVTFVLPNAAEYDVTCKSWGFYATPSMNGRLRDFGFRSALVENPLGRHFVMIVQEGRMAEFKAYLIGDKQHVVSWLDGEPPPKEFT